MSEIVIRKASLDDAEELLEIYRPYVESTCITYEYEVPTVDEFKNRIKTTLQKYPYLVAEKNGEIIGYVYASAFKGRKAYEWSVETSIYVKMGIHKSGVGKALYAALEATLKKMNITNCNACIAYTEVADEYLDQNSVEFHQHMGYRLVGQFHQCAYKFNRWYSMVWMEKMLNEHQNEMKDVIWFSELEYEVD